MQAIEGALQGERLPDTDIRCAAEGIFEFEHNITNQREIFATRHASDDEELSKSVVLEAKKALNNEIDGMLVIDERHAGSDADERAFLIEAQKFMRRRQRINHAKT